MSEPSQSELPALADPDMRSLLIQLGGVLLSTETVETTVELVTALAVKTIENTDGSGVTVVDERGQRTTAASNALVAEADALQYTFDDGPCLAAFRTQQKVRSDDLTTETRWPRWTAAAQELGVRSVLSVPLVTPTSAVGAIKVYSRYPNAYDTRAEQVLSLFAEQAAILLANMVNFTDARQQAAQLTDALKNRDIIGQAKGILVAQGAADAQAAFAMPAAASQRANTKLHVVARRLVDSVMSRNRSQSSGSKREHRG